MPDASTDEIDEILTTSPGALVRHGSAVVGVIAVAMIALSYFVQYPDVVSGRITLLTEDPPAPVLARADGLVERLFVRDGACVNRSSLLGRVATTGDGDAMQALTEKITDVETRHEDPSELAVRLQIEPHTNLGSLHTTYVALIAALTAYEGLVRHD